MKRDFGSLLTEQRNPRSSRIDQLSVPGIIDVILGEDATISRAVRRARGDLIRGVNLLVDRLKKGGRLFFVGAGTSGRLGVLEAAELPPTFGTPPGLAQAIMAGGPECVWVSKEGAEDDAADGAAQLRIRGLRRGDVVLGIAASGVTPFVHGALREGARRQAARILITCSPEGLSAREADVLICARVGPEVITGSTRLRAGTATKMMLNLLTVSSMIRLGKVYENLMIDLQAKSDKLLARAIRIVSLLGGIDEKRASRVIRDSGGRAKTAIVMIRKGLERGPAELLLRQHEGMLRNALES